MNELKETSTDAYPHIIYDAGGSPIRIERVLKGVKCQACPYEVDLGVLVKTENSYTLICPHCSDVSSRRGSDVDRAFRAYEEAQALEAARVAEKVARRDALKRAAAEDDARLAVEIASKPKRQVASKKATKKKAVKKKATRRRA